MCVPLCVGVGVGGGLGRGCDFGESKWSADI